MNVIDRLFKRKRKLIKDIHQKHYLINDYHRLISHCGCKKDDVRWNTHLRNLHKCIFTSRD